MLTSKRKFKRFDLPLRVTFKPTYGAVEYSDGFTRNVSCDGLCLEAKDFNFIQYENLQLNVELPERKASVALAGDVVWKHQERGRSLSGIKLKTDNNDAHKKDMENILSSLNIPGKNIYSRDTGRRIRGEKKKKTVSRTSGSKKRPVQPAPFSGFTKQYLKNDTCRVTFRLPEAAARNAGQVTVVGDFNNWNTTATPMIRLKSGDFKMTLNLDAHREYRFKYLIDGDRWENDWRADRYVANAYGSDDSLLVL